MLILNLNVRMVYLHRKSIFLQQWILNKYVSADNRKTVKI